MPDFALQRMILTNLVYVKHVTEFIVRNRNTFRARFRFRLHKQLNIAEKERRLKIAGREVVLSSQLPNSDIADSDWLVMKRKGF
jgi:hypothetical protein